MTITFERFSSQSFERLAQALVVRNFGKGTLVFGNGPDGGREATFQGKVPFPNESEHWNGYIVAQAKCRENLDNNKSDADWLCRQLKHELEKYFNRKTSVRLPEFFLLITNVGLSSVPGVGGKDRVAKILDAYKAKFKLKGYAIWSADELRAMLDDAEEIRRAYTAWLTPSDVLAELLKRVSRPGLSKLLPLALMRDIRAERDVRLKDAGQESDTPIYLENVFIDLPLVDVEQASSNSRYPKNNQAKRSNALSSILRRASQKLDPASVKETNGKGSPQPNRIVILGGPGQGKSTLSQFAMQVERARFLADQAQTTLNPQTSDLIAPILRRAAEEGLWLSGPLRFPIRISLPDFADLLAETSRSGHTHPSLLYFITAKLARGIDAEITTDDLRAWFGQCPSLIVLDGLDEVPPSANRQSVVDAINALWDDLHLFGADAITIVTTRPQGYNDDLDPNYWQHWELAPLSLERAREFAKRMAEARISDADSQKLIVSQIEQAARDESTSSLVTTPLQVAIMFGIVLLKGAIPKDRWDLFDRYYSLLRDREAQKPASIVRQFKREIDVLHQEVGFLLHVAAEQSGKSVAYFSPDEFRSVILKQLKHEDYTDSEANKIAAQLETAATDRLVFLASRVADQIAFDVRSLQEFMAAAQITSASRVNLMERLRAIAASAHWRNVFRIAASRIFSVADFGHYRNDVLAICHGLDNGDLGEEHRLTRAGGKLALELLSDGLASTAPRFKKGLFRRAMSILDTAPLRFPRELMSQLTDNADTAEEDLRGRLTHSDPAIVNTAFRFLFESLRSCPAWAERLIIEFWPNDPYVALKRVSGADIAASTPAVSDLLRTAQWKAGPVATSKFVNDTIPMFLHETAVERLDALLKHVVLPAGYISKLHGYRRSDDLEIDTVPAEDGGDGFRVVVTPIRLENQIFALERKDCSHPSWECLFAASNFVAQPSRHSLALLLKMAASWPCCEVFLVYLPWVVSTCRALAREGAHFDELVLKAESGDFGDISDWLAAEARWIKHGMSTADVLELNSPNILSPNIATHGAPFFARLSITHKPLDSRRLQSLVQTLPQITSDIRKVRLIESLLFCASIRENYDRAAFASVTSTSLQLLQSLPHHFARDLLQWFTDAGLAPFENVEFLSAAKNVLMQPDAYNFRISDPRDIGVDLFGEIARSFNNDTSNRFLLIILAKAALKADGNLETLRAEAFIGLDSDTIAIRVSAALLAVRVGQWAESDVDWISTELSSQVASAREVMNAFDLAPEHPNTLQLLISVTNKAYSLRGGGIGTLVDGLRALADAQTSTLCQMERRLELDLPIEP